jgi:hypothetical protein
MNRLTSKQTKWLRVLHMISACLWGGGALSMVMLHCLFTPVSGEALFGRDICLKLVDQYVVTSGALGCLLTGFLFAWKNGWGFFKFKWIVIKWIINLGFIIFGFAFYMPWLEHMSDLSANTGDLVLQTPEYLRSQSLNEISAFAVLGCLIFLVWVSVFKPWGKLTFNHTPHDS